MGATKHSTIRTPLGVRDIPGRSRLFSSENEQERLVGVCLWVSRPRTTSPHHPVARREARAGVEALFGLFLEKPETWKVKNGAEWMRQPPRQGQRFTACWPQLVVKVS